MLALVIYTLLWSSSTSVTKANAKAQDLNPKELESIDLNFPLKFLIFV